MHGPDSNISWFSKGITIKAYHCLLHDVFCEIYVDLVIGTVVIKDMIWDVRIQKRSLY